MKKRVLVTGASGFVGAVLGRRLVSEGHDVHLMIRPGTDSWRLEGVDAPRAVVDLSGDESVAEEVRRIRPEWVFHLAAHGGYSAQKDWRRMVETNVAGTMHLVEACLRMGFEAFVNTGSSSEYGFTDHPPVEIECPRPNSDYAVTKAAATLFCRFAAERNRARISTLRLYSVYGPYEEPTRFVPTLALAGLEGKLPPLVSPRVARDFVFIDDVVDAYILAASRADVAPGAIWNVGTGRQVTVEKAVGVARSVLRIDAEPRWGTMPNRAWDSETWVANPARIRGELGWEPRIQFEEGFRRFVAWLRENPKVLALYRKRRP